MAGLSSARFSFGLFEVDLIAGELYRHGRLIPLQDQPFRILSVLVERPGQLVTREELRKKLWPDGTFVEFDQGIDTALKKLRQALGDSAQNPIFIETVPRSGYRLIAPVSSNSPIGRDFPAMPQPAAVPGSTEARTPTAGGVSSPGSKTQIFRVAPALKYLALAAVTLLAAVIYHSYRSTSAKTPLALKFRQLTINSIENPVTSGAVSPDGKYLAYSDGAGIHIRLVDTGETRTISPREIPDRDTVDWEIPGGAWFPDSTRFLVNARPAGIRPNRWTSELCSIWMFSVLGAPAKLRDNAAAGSVSPDGSSISFTSNSGRRGDREIWLMDPSGDHAYQFLPANNDRSFGRLHWSPDGLRLLYVETDNSGDLLVSRGLDGGRTLTSVPNSHLTNLGDISWLPDGRLLYSVREPQTFDESCNYWTVRLDIASGKVIEAPKQLTHSVGSCLNYASVTRDGKRLAFHQSSNHAATYMADLESGGMRILNPRRFNLEDGEQAIADWTADSQTVILLRNFTDHYSLFKQSLNTSSPVPIATSAPGSLLASAQVSPDGNWVILQAYSILGGPTAPMPLMRVALSGGSPELLFPVPAGSGFSCARRPSNLCALAEPSSDRKQLVVTALDPVKGRRGMELVRLDLEIPKDDFWPLFGLAPDGTRLAISRGAQGPIQILSLRGRPTQVIRAKELTGMRLLGWAGDQKGLFVVRGVNDGTDLLHVDLRGNTHLLWKCRGGQQCDFTPSPNGHYLAILDRELMGNMWIMENF